MLREALTAERLDAMAPGEAAAWFVAQTGEGLTAPEEALLAGWLAADPAHERAYSQARRAWEAFDQAEDNELLAAIRGHALAPPARRWPAWPRMAAAAAVVLAVAIGVTLQLGRSPAPGIETVRYAAADSTREITLPDGSVMTLDAQSVALARFGEDERSIELESGRALFDVKPDADSEFAVTAGTRRVVALGTEFEVDLAPKRLAVTLFEGRVGIGPAAGTLSVTLDPGEQFVEANGASTVRKLETAAPASWRSGLLDFDDRPLAEAVAEINRYSREPIVIRDPKVGALRISGQFRAGDAGRFADTVAEIHPLQIVRREGAIELVADR